MAPGAYPYSLSALLARTRRDETLRLQQEDETRRCIAREHPIFYIGSVVPLLLASLFLFYGREAWHLSNAVQEPVNFITGLYFPVRALGSYVAGAASLIPVSLGLDAIRQLLLPGTYQLIPVGLETLRVALQLPVYALLAYVLLRLMEARARRDGRLITKWA